MQDQVSTGQSSGSAAVPRNAVESANTRLDAHAILHQARTHQPESEVVFQWFATCICVSETDLHSKHRMLRSSFGHWGRSKQAWWLLLTRRLHEEQVTSAKAVSVVEMRLQIWFPTNCT